MTVATHAAAAQRAGFGPAGADQRHDLVTVDDRAMLVDHDQPVRVAVERNADVCARGDHRFLQQAWRSRAAAVIDVGAVGRDAELHQLAPSSQKAAGAVW